MNAFMLFTGIGPMIVLTRYNALDDDVFRGKLRAKGFEKFLAFGLPIEEVAARYGSHFNQVVHDLHETDDLRVLDNNGQRIFSRFRLSSLGKPFAYEPDEHKNRVYVD